MKNFFTFFILLFAIAVFCVPRLCSGKPKLTPIGSDFLLDGNNDLNWVCASSKDKLHKVDKWEVTPRYEHRLLKDILSTMPRMKVVKFTDDYIYAEHRSLILGLYNDIEILWEPTTNLLSCKSATRLVSNDYGWSLDMYNTIAQKLAEHHLIYDIDGKLNDLK